MSDSDRMLFLLNNGNTVHLTYNLLVNGGKQSNLRTVDIQTPVDKIFLSKDRFILNKDNKLFLLNPDLQFPNALSWIVANLYRRLF